MAGKTKFVPIAKKSSGNYEFVGFFPRLVAAIIDAVFSAVVFGVGWVINIYLISAYGFTIGKKIMKMKIIKEDGKDPDLVDAIVREIPGKIASALILGIGFLMVGFDQKKQGLHDKIAKTYVVKA